jgi:hypothetical protein
MDFQSPVAFFVPVWSKFSIIEGGTLLAVTTSLIYPNKKS